MFSRSVEAGFDFFLNKSSKEHKELFADSIHTRELTRKLNDVFDVLNGRHLKESINQLNWKLKREVIYLILQPIRHKCEKIKDKSKHRSNFKSESLDS